MCNGQASDPCLLSAYVSPTTCGDGARRHGGRWNPPESFPVVYAALDVSTVDREYARSLRLAALPLTSSPRSLATIRVRLSRVLDLTDAARLKAMDMKAGQIAGDDIAVPRSIGEVAEHPGFEAILAPSATGKGEALAVFLNNRAADSELPVEAEDPEHRPAGSTWPDTGLATSTGR